MHPSLHLLQGLLSDDDFIDILLDTVEQELVLLFFDTGDGKFAEDLAHCFKLAQLSEVAIGLIDHFLHQVVL